MGMRGNMWITDSQGQRVNGSCNIMDREGSIEVHSMNHKITLPADLKTGQLTGNRVHSPVTILKQVDESTPFLNKACCSGECLQEVRIDLWNVSPHGMEQCYFTYQLQNVRIIGVNPVIGGTEDNYTPDKEKIALMYETITWHHHQGNHQYSDSWLVRR